MSNLCLPFDGDHDSMESRLDARDRAGRARAVDPRFNVVLEASAGTGKTRVLVERYVNLLRTGVDPSNVLAITFTRKAASEMRERIMAALRTAAARGELTVARWRELRDRTADITISTIDAFCLSLLREFPLEADLDPGFSMLDETEVPRVIDESLDRTLRICRASARDDEDVALAFAQLGERRARAGLSALLHRRIVAPHVLARFLATGPANLDVQGATRGAATAMIEALEAVRGGLDAFIGSGPLEPAFVVLSRDLRKLRDALRAMGRLDSAVVQAALVRLREHFLTQDGNPRTRLPYAKTQFANIADWRMHRDLVTQHGEVIRRVLGAYRRDTNVLVSRGIWRMFRVADAEYRRTLDAHAALDYAELLLRTLDLLRRMDEFAQSRYRLESRYHHVLVDECQDTSRAQWELVSLLIQSWGEGAGMAHSGPLQPSIFVVGDRKQSIYGFRDADVSLLGEAARQIAALRANGDVRRSISRSFRSVPPLLSFVNDICHDLDKTPDRGDAFVYEEEDRFPLAGVDAAAVDQDEAIGLVLSDTAEACAEITAAEIARLIATATPIRDPETGVRRPVRPGDIAIVFRTRDSHREFEAALARRNVPTYVYKGLGFFDADEIKDVLALLWYLAEPLSDLRAAAFMRSRFIRLSDEALRLLAPGLAEALRAVQPPDAIAALDDADSRALIEARTATVRWRGLVDRIPPAELLDLILSESAYGLELRGPRFRQARENLKKIRGLVRRIQNRGYATLGRIAAHLDRLAVGDEANAVIDAVDAVSLMTIHASKGLEFPVVFLVNLARGTGNRRDPVRLTANLPGDSVSVAVGDFQSEGDEDSRLKDVEETKRLLYVALTRARDRLYLGSTLKDGQVQPGRGSLAEVLPKSLLDELTAEAARTQGVSWRASSGTVHRLRLVCADAWRGCTPRQAGREGPPYDRHVASTRVESDFAPLTDAAPRRLSIAAAVSEAEDGVHQKVVEGSSRESDRLVGTLVHRLLQRFGVEGQDPDVVTRDAAFQMLRLDEAVGASLEEGPLDDRLIDHALAVYRAICGRPDVRELYASGSCLHEVPFSMRAGGMWLRGTIDCLIRTAPDCLTVLEFKTGRPRDEDRAQIDLYRRAAEQVFPGCTIETRLVYAGTQRAGSKEQDPACDDVRRAGLAF